MAVNNTPQTGFSGAKLPEITDEFARLHQLQREAEERGDRARARELYVLENKVIQEVATDMEIQMCRVEGWSEK